MSLNLRGDNGRQETILIKLLVMGNQLDDLERIYINIVINYNCKENG